MDEKAGETTGLLNENGAQVFSLLAGKALAPSRSIFARHLHHRTIPARGGD
jgi:hypothetical protein